MSENEFTSRIEQSEAAHTEFQKWWVENKARIIAENPNASEWRLEMAFWHEFKINPRPKGLFDHLSGCE